MKFGVKPTKYIQLVSNLARINSYKIIMKSSIFFKNYQPLTTNQNNYRLIYADYVVLDLKRQWFVNDMGSLTEIIRDSNMAFGK